MRFVVRRFEIVGLVEAHRRAARAANQFARGAVGISFPWTVPGWHAASRPTTPKTNDCVASGHTTGTNRHRAAAPFTYSLATQHWPWYC